METARRLLPVGEVARRFGLRVSTLRYYEERGLVVPAARRGNGRRYYGTPELQRIAFVLLVQRIGLVDLAAIGELLAGSTTGALRWHGVMQERLAELRAQMAQLRAAQSLVRHMASCPRADPLAGCPVLTAELQRVVDAGLGEVPARGPASQARTKRPRSPRR